MRPEQFRWVAAVVASHKDGKVTGRTRLQKTIYLLQRKGLPTGFSYSLHFYGPYSEGLNSEVRQAQHFGLLTETPYQSATSEYYIFEAHSEAQLPEFERFTAELKLIQDAGDVPLELAATYDSFREMGYGHSDAMDRLRRKKGAKCTPANEALAMRLLQAIGLPAEV